MAEFSGRNADIHDPVAGVAVASGFEPGIVGVPVDFFFERIENAQPRIRTKSRAWDGHNEIHCGPRLGQAWINRFSLQYCFFCQQRSVIHELAADEINLLRQCVMLAQNISVCGNLFAIFWRHFYFTRVEKILSSGELITAARVVQKAVIGRWLLASER